MARLVDKVAVGASLTFMLFLMMIMVSRGVLAGVESYYPSMIMLDGEELYVTPDDDSSSHEATTQHERQRRYLLFRNNSILQFTFLYAMPITLFPKRILMQVLGGQIGYDLPFTLNQLTVQDIARQDHVDVAIPHVLRSAEAMMDQKGLPGRACMLLVVCQIAETPFEREAGLLEDILHMLLTPSEGTHSADWTSKEEERQYLRAEYLGRNGATDCRTEYPECNISIIDAFSRIMLTK